MQQLVNLSPPIGSKVRKIIGAIKTYDFNKDIMSQMDYNINNPAWNMITSVIEGTTNAPVARIQHKLSNVREAVVGDHEMWQRIALVFGWSKWDVGIKDAEVEEARKEVKEKRKEEKKLQKEKDKKKEQEEKKKAGIKSVRCSGIKSNGSRCSIMVDTKAKTAKCMYHKSYKANEASDRDGDGIKEYRCKATTGSGKRCKNRTENKNKKCYAHQ